MDYNDDDFDVYVNPMEFPLNFRAMWLPGNPSIRIEPGQTISGPKEYLANYRFLMPVKMKMHKVSSITVDNDGKFRDISEDKEEVIVIKESDVVEVETEENNDKASPDVIASLPLDLGDRKVWLAATMENLETCCKILDITIPQHIMALHAKSRKWEIVKLIKKKL